MLILPSGFCGKLLRFFKPVAKTSLTVRYVSSNGFPLSMTYPSPPAAVKLETANLYLPSFSTVLPLIFRGFGALGLNPLNIPVNVMIAAWDWGRYLGIDALEKGISVKISSWNRAAPNTFPMMAKISGNYVNSQLVKIDALQDGYDEGVAS